MLFNSPSKLRWWLALAVVLLAGTSRLAGFLPNFSPLTAICLLSAAIFASCWAAVSFSLVAIWLSDVAINHLLYASEGFHFFYPGSHWQYATYAIIAAIGFGALKKLTLSRVVGSSLGASLLFFGLSNFGTWASTGLYAKSWAGLGQCYLAALPFLKGTMTGDLCYTAVCFSAFFWLQQHEKSSARLSASQSQA